MMKKVIIYILYAFIIVGCTESTFDATRTPSLNRRFLNVPVSTLNFMSEASTKSIRIESDETPWKVNVPSSWLSISPSTGNSSTDIQFTTQLNNSADTSRVCVTEIISEANDWERSFPVTITQEKAVPYLEFENTSLTIDSREQSKNISISSNTDFSIINNAENWLHVVSQSANGIILNIDENNTSDERIGIITIKGKVHTNVSSFLTIRQKKANITSSLETLLFGHEASTQNITIESGASWKVTSSAWLTVSPSSGNAGSSIVSIMASNNASANDREGSVYFTIEGTNCIELPVKQEGFKLSVSNAALSFDSFANSQSLDIVSNAEWIISDKPEWVTISNMTGNGNLSLTVSVSDNGTTLYRQGTITISTANNVVTKHIDVTQSAKWVDYTDSTLSFGYSASTQSISFATDAKWSLINEQDWITIDKSSGDGDATLNISVEENKSTESRIGIVTLFIADKTFSIAITQDCKNITINSSAFTFDAAPGTSILSISSNTQWNANVTKGTDWLEISPKNGTNNADISITVKENNTVSARTGEIVVEIPNGRSYIVNVTQNRKYIRTDMSSVDFGAAGGQITFTISTDGKYEISKIGNWFGFIKSGDVITVVTTENNTATERIGAIVLTLTNIDDGNISIMIPVTQTIIRDDSLSQNT